MRGDMLKIKIIKDLTYHMTNDEDQITGYDTDMFWDLLDLMNTARQNEIWHQKELKQAEKTEAE